MSARTVQPKQNSGFGHRIISPTTDWFQAAPYMYHHQKMQSLLSTDCTPAAPRPKNTNPSPRQSLTSTSISTLASAPTATATTRAIAKAKAPSSNPKPELERVSLRKKPSAGILSTTITRSGTRTTRITTTTTATTPRPVTAQQSGTRSRHLATATTTVTTTRAVEAAKPAKLSRHPLRARDHNAALLRSNLKLPLSSNLQDSMTTARMPYERAPASTSSRQPQLPTVARGLGTKPPLTPKIAARAPTSQQHQNVAVVTPLPRRVPRPESILSNNGTTPKDDVASPVSAFLNTNNITPRSGSRQSRVDSTNSTPTGTPSIDRSDLWETRSGLGISSPAIDDVQRRPAVTLSPPLEVGGALKQDKPDSKFFYASDAQKPPAAVSSRQPIQQQQKPATFFYANRAAVPQQRDSAPPTPTISAPMLANSAGQDPLMSKFVYANGALDRQPTPKSRPNSVISTTSRIPTNRPVSTIPQLSHGSHRPASPIKLSPHPPPNSGSNSAVASPRSPVYPGNSLGQQVNPRPSSQGPPKPSHVRSPSLTIAEPPAVARIMSARSSVASSECASPLDPPLNPQPTNPATTSFASLLQAAEEFAEEEEARPDSLNSPTKGSSQDAQLNELVANARRERKVQDLQITNASLEAINRTLERQLRKQTAEIRRYKRLSRSGRLSLNPMGSRIPSDSTVNGGGLARAGLGLDDLSEEESEMEGEDAEFDDEDDFSPSEDGSGDLSPSAEALRDARHRQRDEARLQLDLTKHQQLLIDSQKINQSLKRCLGWTEELIKEGKRALEYQVRVSEIELGGRVLAPEEVEGDDDDGDDDDGDDDDLLNGDDTLQGLELPEAGTFVDGLAAQPWSKDAQDRDSGVELPTDGG